MMAYNLGLKLIPLAIAAFGLVGSPAVTAMESGGDRDRASEVSPGEQSRAAQCEDIGNAVTTAEKLQSELQDVPQSSSDAPPPTAEVIEYLRATSRIFSQMSGEFAQLELSDALLQSPMERVTSIFSSLSSDFDQVASLMAVVETQQQQLQQSGAVDPDDPASLQAVAEPLSNIGEMVRLLGRVKQSRDELQTLFADLEPYCRVEESGSE